MMGNVNIIDTYVITLRTQNFINQWQIYLRELRDKEDEPTTAPLRLKLLCKEITDRHPPSAKQDTMFPTNTVREF